MLLYLWRSSLHPTHLQDIAQVPVHLGRWNTFWTVYFPSVFNSSNEKTAKRYQNARCVIEILPWHIPNWPKVCEAGVALPSVSSCLNLRPVMSVQFPELTENNTWMRTFWTRPLSARANPNATLQAGESSPAKCQYLVDLDWVAGKPKTEFSENNGKSPGNLPRSMR